MENVTDEVSNPFGMRPPCPHRCEGGHDAVFGYGDANADFHVIGDHPRVHGGTRSGIPFTDNAAGAAILDVLDRTGLISDRDGDLTPEGCYLSYLYLCCVPEDGTPTAADYRDMEPFFDAELRAIAADVLLPVGHRPTGHVLETFSARAHRVGNQMDQLHARQIHGRGFLILPIKDPTAWRDGDRDRIVGAIRSLRATDYRQLVDLGRFLPGGDPYLVR